MQHFLENEHDLNTYITKLENNVVLELMQEFPECTGYGIDSRLKTALSQIFVQTGNGFIFIIDEWDCVFRIAKNHKKAQKEYLDFLRALLKDSEYTELAYMIFTKEEVFAQCRQQNIPYTEIEKWYDGYRLGNLHIYNPKSVVDALTWHEFQSYWTGTETYEALKIYIDLNFDGLKEAITIMLGNGHCKINTRRFQNDMTTFQTKDDVLTLLIHLGYLTYDKNTEEAFIPNQEIAQEFLNAVEGPSWNGLIQAISHSEEILMHTWTLNGDAEKLHTCIIEKYMNE